MVRSAATVDAVTSRPLSEYTPDRDEDVVEERDEDRDRVRELVADASRRCEIRISETMTAMIAPRRICSEKLAETFLKPKSSRFELLARAPSGAVLLVARERLRAKREARVLVAVRGLAAALDDRVRPGRRRPPRARTSSTEWGSGVANVAWLPPSEVDAEVQPLDGERAEADQEDDARDREPDPPLADEVDLLPARDPRRARAHERAGCRTSGSRPRTPSRARVARTAVTIERSVPSRSMRAKPRTLPVPTRKRTAAVIIVTTLRVDDRGEALPIAGRRWRRARICPRAPPP